MFFYCGILYICCKSLIFSISCIYCIFLLFPSVVHQDFLTTCTISGQGKFIEVPPLRTQRHLQSSRLHLKRTPKWKKITSDPQKIKIFWWLTQNIFFKLRFYFVSFNYGNKALCSFLSASGVHFKVHRGSIKNAPRFIWCTVKWTLVHSQLKPGALSIKPWCTLKWTTKALWNEPRALFSELKKKYSCKKKKNLGKSLQSLNILISLLSIVNCQLGNPFKLPNFNNLEGQAFQRF